MSENTHTLESGLKAELEHYRSILQLSRKQGTAIDSGDTNQLLNLLEQKKDLIEKINGVEKDISVFKQQWETRREAYGEEERSGIETLFTDIREVLSQIIEYEDKSRGRAEGKKADTSKKLEGKANLKRIRRAYGGGSSGNHIVDGLK